MRKGLLLLSLLWFAGCGGPPRGEVEGTLRRGGKPLEKVLVTFYPERGGKPASGVTDAQGRFTLKAEGGMPGVAAGSYRVVFEDLAINDAPRDREGTVLKLPPQRLPAGHGDPLSTPVRKQVEVTSQVIDFDLGPP